MKKPKVAVCISGQMRSYQATHPAMMSELVKPLDAVVFIHTWSDAGETTQPRRQFPLLNRIDNKCRFLRPLTKPLFNLLQKGLEQSQLRDRRVTSQRLARMYQTDHVRIEDFPENGMRALHGGVLPSNLLKRIDELVLKYPEENIVMRAAIGMLPMFYKIWACDQLRLQYEKEHQQEFDIVIRTRPDIAIAPQLFKKIQTSVDILSTGISSPVEVFEEHGAQRFPDQLFWGSGGLMKEVSAIWKILPALFKEMAVDPDYELFGGERIMNFYLDKNPQILREIVQAHCGIRRPEVNPFRLLSQGLFVRG